MNPGKEKFVQCINSEIYIDKTGLIRYCNKVMNSLQKYISMSRPRRFGKSVTADMLAAYYSRGCDCGDLFAGLEIAEDEHYTEHMNRYNVLFLNMQEFLSQSSDMPEMLALLKKSLLWDMLDSYTELKYFDKTNLTRTMQDIFNQTKIPFVIIIDEWDCIFREYRMEGEAQKLYLDFLRDMLKDKGYIALCYMTGILPIKKYGTHSALNMFDEFSMVFQGALAEYAGFTEAEVRGLCQRYGMDFEETKKWLTIYFGGKVPDFTPPLRMETAPFRKAVWEIMLTIPYGQTMTYSQIADRIAKQKGLERMSAQAVGGAVAHNAISLIVPCHRVVGTNGSLTGYAGGVDLKEKLLLLEKTDIPDFFNQ